MEAWQTFFTGVFIRQDYQSLFGRNGLRQQFCEFGMGFVSRKP
jgi:hypothetical protein